MNLTFLEFTPKHIAACLALFDSNLGKYFAPYERDEYRRWLQRLPNEDSPYFVVMADSKVVAAGGVALEHGIASLTWGMVNSDLHGQGIGEFLTHQRLAVISDRYSDVPVQIDTSQHTQGFYQRFGFVITLLQPDGFSPGIDRVVMRRQSHVEHGLTTTPPFDTSIILEGETLRLAPLKESDFDALYSAASDPEIWALHPASDRYQEPVFRAFFMGGLESNMAYRIELKDSNKVIGSSRYNAPDYDNSRVEIGWTFLSKDYWGGKFNAELKHLMLYFAFKTFDTVEFCIGKDNHRSIAAVKKLGAKYNSERQDPNRPDSVFFCINAQSYVGLTRYGK